MAEFKNMNELFQYWENNNTYPDYVCGIWSTDGTLSRLTVGVNDKNAENVILSLIENDSSVAFVYQKYSKNYLLSVIDEMNCRFSEIEYAEKTGFVSMGLNEYDNRVDIAFKIDFEENSDTLALVAELTECFGDAVNVDYTDALIEFTVDDLMLHPDKSGKNTVVYAPVSYDKPDEPEINALESNLVICCVILVVSVLMLFTALIFQRKRLLVLTDGTVKNDGYNKKYIENIIKNSMPETPAGLDLKIMEAINNKGE